MQSRRLITCREDPSLTRQTQFVCTTGTARPVRRDRKTTGAGALQRIGVGIALGCAVLLPSGIKAATPATTAPASAPATLTKVRLEYRKPKNPAHEALYAELRGRHVLERMQEALSAIRLPRTLTLAFAGCDGDANAWYDAQSTTVTFCYEYLAEMQQRAATRPLGNVPQRDATEGPAVFVMLHETGHAVFDLLQVPILGREEDAADTFATMVMLQLGKEEAFRLLRGAAWSYQDWASTEKPDKGDLADMHPLDAQRFYNILCLAYGSEPKYFAAAVTEKLLPADRAEDCPGEYQQALFAIQKTILPSVAPENLRRVFIERKENWMGK